MIYKKMDIYTVQFIIAFIIATGGSLWVYHDAKNRGMKEVHILFWITITFLALIIGLPLYLLSRPKGKIVKCQKCNNEMLETLEKCPHCDTIYSYNTGDAEEVPIKRKICISCGKIIEISWKFCPYCGSEQKIDEEKDDENS